MIYVSTADAVSTTCAGSVLSETKGLGLVPGPCRERNAFPDAGPGQAAPACLPVPRIRKEPSPFQAEGTLWCSTPPHGQS